MRPLAAIGIALSLALGIVMLPTQQNVAQTPLAAAADTPAVGSDQIPVHTREEFAFSVAAPLERALPLFGAVRERDWAPDWSPDVIWPAPAIDREGMVLSVAHGDKTAVWVNTALDPIAHRVQYVYVIPGVVATVISIGLTPRGADTDVSVRYERTALAADANHVVEGMAVHDRAAGPVWQRQIKQYLSARRD